MCIYWTCIFNLFVYSFKWARSLLHHSNFVIFHVFVLLDSLFLCTFFLFLSPTFNFAYRCFINWNAPDTWASIKLYTFHTTNHIPLSVHRSSIISLLTYLCHFSKSLVHCKGKDLNSKKYVKHWFYGQKTEWYTE